MLGSSIIEFTATGEELAANLAPVLGVGLGDVGGLRSS